MIRMQSCFGFCLVARFRSRWQERGPVRGGLGPAKVASDTNIQRKLHCVLYTFAVLCSNSSSFLNVSLQYWASALLKSKRCTKHSTVTPDNDIESLLFYCCPLILSFLSPGLRSPRPRSGPCQKYIRGWVLSLARKTESYFAHLSPKFCRGQKARI